MKTLSVFIAGLLVGIVIADRYTKMSLNKKNDTLVTPSDTPPVEGVLQTPKKQ